MVCLYIEQEVFSVVGVVMIGFSDLIINKCIIQIMVLVDNGEIIVLGGLIEQDDQSIVNGVFGFFCVFGVGCLFCLESDIICWINLMVFICLIIICSEVDMQVLMENCYDYIVGQQCVISESNSSSLEEIMNMLMVDFLVVEVVNDD